MFCFYTQAHREEAGPRGGDKALTPRAVPILWSTRKVSTYFMILPNLYLNYLFCVVLHNIKTMPLKNLKQQPTDAVSAIFVANCVYIDIAPQVLSHHGVNHWVDLSHPFTLFLDFEKKNIVISTLIT